MRVGARLGACVRPPARVAPAAQRPAPSAAPRPREGATRTWTERCPCHPSVAARLFTIHRSAPSPSRPPTPTRAQPVARGVGAMGGLLALAPRVASARAVLLRASPRQKRIPTPTPSRLPNRSQNTLRSRTTDPHLMSIPNWRARPRPRARWKQARAPEARSTPPRESSIPAQLQTHGRSHALTSDGK